MKQIPSDHDRQHNRHTRVVHLAARLLLCLLLWLPVAARFVPGPAHAAPPQPMHRMRNPDYACAECHQAIFRSYEHTSMAQGSGTAIEGILQGGFTHTPSGVEYKVFLRDGQAWMSYARTSPPAASDATQTLSGERQLRYFIGSGHRGRTYLYQQQGLWFEIPINYYGKKSLWDMAPAYGSTHFMPDSLPVDPNCLHCHATAVQPSLAEARNRFADAPFLQGGIGCSACHGDPTVHLAQHGNGPILNPSHLTATRRDSVCLQCHLEGEAAIYRKDSSLTSFRPGDDLGSHVLYFVRAKQPSGDRATSQYEALLRSACKIASGDKLTCTTCHDPHSTPSAAERVAYFRSRCLTCHTGEDIATNHHPEQQDCAVCHMPTRDTTDISHEQLTDHDIQARASRKPTLQGLADISSARNELVPVGRVEAPNRELGLAYAQRAIHGDRAALEQGLALLREAERENANDAAVHLQLGVLEQLTGNGMSAAGEYRKALAQDPDEVNALANLAILEATSGHATEAVELLRKAVTNDPSRSVAALNLAFIECRMGDTAAANKTLATLEQFNPDNPQLRTFLATGSYAGQHCTLHPETKPNASR